MTQPSAVFVLIDFVVVHLTPLLALTGDRSSPSERQKIQTLHHAGQSAIPADRPVSACSAGSSFCRQAGPQHGENAPVVSASRRRRLADEQKSAPTSAAAEDSACRGSVAVSPLWQRSPSENFARRSPRSLVEAPLPLPRGGLLGYGKLSRWRRTSTADEAVTRSNGKLLQLFRLEFE